MISPNRRQPKLQQSRTVGNGGTVTESCDLYGFSPDASRPGGGDRRVPVPDPPSNSQYRAEYEDYGRAQRAGHLGTAS